MTALNFPATPSDGDTFDNYIYDGVKEVWRIQPNIPGISSTFKVSATAPASPKNGEIWLNSTDGNTYIYYVDTDSAQWIEIGGTGGGQGEPGPQGQPGPQGIQGPAGTSINVVGVVSTVEELPSTENTINDAYFVQADGNLYVWTGAEWVNVGQIQGPTGPAGPPGADGLDGATGATGATGETGAAGPAGDGSGDVLGPASATDNAITRYDSTTGKLIQNSLATIADDGSINIPSDTASFIPFYYATLASFPTASSSHGVIAHAHDTGKLYYAHGSWIELANLSDIPEPVESGGEATTFSATTDATSAGLTIDQIAYPAITRLDVTSSGTSAYLFNNQYSGNNPTIFAISGTTIAFNLNVPGHPFLIRFSGANYNTGLIHVSTTGVLSTGSNAQGKTSGTLYWQLPANISGAYGYLCSVHSSMAGTITVKDIATI